MVRWVLYLAVAVGATVASELSSTVWDEELSSTVDTMSTEQQQIQVQDRYQIAAMMVESGSDFSKKFSASGPHFSRIAHSASGPQSVSPSSNLKVFQLPAHTDFVAPTFFGVAD